MIRPQRLTAWAGLLTLLATASAQAAQLNVVRGLQVSRQGDDTVVSIGGSQSPVYSVFKLENPKRLVVDLVSADLSAVQGTVAGQGPVKGVAASQFTDEKKSVGRVVISLADDASYEVQASGDKVLVNVRDHGDAEHADAAPVSAPAATPAPAVQPAPVAPVAAARAPAPASAVQAAAPATAPAAGGDPHLVRRELRKKHLAHAATRLLAAHISRRSGATRLELTTNAPVGTYTLLELRDPPRLAIDLPGVRSAGRLKISAAGPIKDLRAGRQPDGLRVVVDTDTLTPGSYVVKRSHKGLEIAFAAPVEAVVADSTPPSPAARPAAAPAKHVQIHDVSFKGDENHAEVEIAVAHGASYAVTHPDAHTAVLTFKSATLPAALQRTLDTSAFGGPVRMVSSFSGQSAGEVQIVASLDGEVTDQLVESPKGLRWAFESPGEAEMTLDGVKVDLTDSARAAGLEAEAPAYALSGAPRRPRYTGRRVSFEFKDIDIHNLLRIIAEVSHKNIIVADDVSGKVTIRLRNVPWDQALDVILKSKGLDKEENGNIIRVAKASQLAAERKAALEKRQLEDEAGPLKLRIIPVNYADASEMADRVKDLLSKRGSVTVDKRTNVLIVKDIAESLGRVEGLVRTLDLQTPQVLIEARIVEANSTFTRELGIQWGGNLSFSPATGNPTGLSFPNTMLISGGSSINVQNPGLNATPNFAVDLPAAVGTGNGAGLGLIFGSAGGAAQLNLRISALENSGDAKTISAPKVTTLDNQSATISQGVAIPFSQFSAGGVNTTFIEAKLELRVKPHVTQDGSVAMVIDATNNQPDPGFTGANGQPSISKKEAHTQVLVKDGDTTVIGGIYTRATAENQNGVPLLSKIPVLGWLFRHKLDTDTRTELLIFVTPHIVNRSQAIAAAGAPPPSVSNQ